jgi:ribonuclease VapC
VIIDTSALVAILRGESDARAYTLAIYDASGPRLSAANLLETAIVIDARGDPVASRRLEEFVQEASITIEPFTAEQARIGREAYRDFGKGSGHPAQLNYGDCFAYALAKTTGEPLLFKGRDFGYTDVRLALPP